MRIPLISMLTKATDYQDKDLVKDLTIRMPIVGKRPAANTLKKRTRDATAYLERWRAALPAINRANVERVTRDWDSLLAKVAWGGRTLQEVELGRVSQPVPLNEACLDTVPFTPRFAHKEQGGAKVRMIGDFKASTVSELLPTVDTAVPQTLGMLYAACAYYSLICPGARLSV